MNLNSIYRSNVIIFMKHRVLKDRQMKTENKYFSTMLETVNKENNTLYMQINIKEHHQQQQQQQNIKMSYKKTYLVTVLLKGKICLLYM